MYLHFIRMLHKNIIILLVVKLLTLNVSHLHALRILSQGAMRSVCVYTYLRFSLIAMQHNIVVERIDIFERHVFNASEFPRRLNFREKKKKKTHDARISGATCDEK